MKIVVNFLLFACCFLFQANFVLCRFNVEEINSLFYDVSISSIPVLKKSEEDLGSENFVLGNKNGQQYVCTMPTLNDESSADQTTERLRRIEQILNLTESDVLETVHMLQHRKCLTKTVGWWTYEFCHNRAIYQYHLEAGRISGEKIVLGRFESDQIFNHTNLIDEFVDRKQTLYHSQFYTNGSLCNLNSKLRKTEARFFCDEDATLAELNRIDEPETCQYIFNIGMADLCLLPAFLSIDRKPDPTNISCQPFLSADEYQIYEREEQVRLEKEKLQKESATKSDTEKEYSVLKMSSYENDKVTESEKNGAENEQTLQEMWKKIELALEKNFEKRYEASAETDKKKDNMQIVDLNVNLGGKLKNVGSQDETVDGDEFESKEVDEDDALLADFEKDLKDLFSRESLQYDRGALRRQVESQYDQLVQEARNEVTYSPEDQMAEDDQAAGILSSTLNKLIDRLDRAEREIEMANEQLEVAEQKLLVASKKLEQILKTDKTFKNEEISKKASDSHSQENLQDIDSVNEDRASSDDRQTTSSKKTDAQSSRSSTPMGRIRIKKSEDQNVRQDDSNRVKVRVSKIKTHGLPEKAMGKVSEETQKLEAQLASKLKKAGLDAKGGNVQVKIITSGYYDEDTNNFHMLSDDESQQFSNIILSLLGGDEQNREEKRQKSLEDNYDFKFNKK